LQGAAGSPAEAAQPPRELLLLLTLAGMQFTNILDFMIMMPLAPQLMRLLDIDPQQFGLLVSAYTFAAAASGFVAAFWIDRFGRKRALLAMYTGFVAATALCGFAPDYPLLIAARIIAGIFGGVIGALVLTIIADVVPYVANVGLLETELPYIYFAGGITTLFTAPLIGRLADRYGKKRVFTTLAFISIAPIVVITHLPRLSLGPVIVVTILFFVFVPGRFGPATALITGSVAPRLRGSFMSFIGAVQQLGAGAASFAAGLVIGRGADGSLTHYDWAGWGAVAATLVAVVLARSIMIVPDGSRGPE
jgi:predicted MFS family arabinose efflux permease